MSHEARYMFSRLAVGLTLGLFFWWLRGRARR
jgi:hypothetical protein